MLMKTCGSVNSLTPKSSCDLSFMLNEGSKLIFMEHFVAGTLLGTLSHFIWTVSHLEGGKGGDIPLSGEKVFRGEASS